MCFYLYTRCNSCYDYIDTHLKHCREYQWPTTQFPLGVCKADGTVDGFGIDEYFRPRDRMSVPVRLQFLGGMRNCNLHKPRDISGICIWCAEQEDWDHEDFRRGCGFVSKMKFLSDGSINLITMGQWRFRKGGMLGWEGDDAEADFAVFYSSQQAAREDSGQQPFPRVHGGQRQIPPSFSPEELCFRVSQRGLPEVVDERRESLRAIHTRSRQYYERVYEMINPGRHQIFWDQQQRYLTLMVVQQQQQQPPQDNVERMAGIARDAALNPSLYREVVRSETSSSSETSPLFSKYITPLTTLLQTPPEQLLQRTSGLVNQNVISNTPTSTPVQKSDFTPYWAPSTVSDAAYLKADTGSIAVNDSGLFASANSVREPTAQADQIFGAIGATFPGQTTAIIAMPPLHADFAAPFTIADDAQTTGEGAFGYLDFEPQDLTANAFEISLPQFHLQEGHDPVFDLIDFLAGDNDDEGDAAAEDQALLDYRSASPAIPPGMEHQHEYPPLD